MSKDSKERIEQAKRDLAKTLANQNVRRIKLSDKKKPSCNCNIEDDGGRCGYCDRSFEKIASFVMHVAQNKLCKEFYGKNIEVYKTISRKISKQKWYCQMAHGPNAKQFKEERKRQRQANTKKYYVPKSVRYSETHSSSEKSASSSKSDGSSVYRATMRVRFFGIGASSPDSSDSSSSGSSSSGS